MGIKRSCLLSLPGLSLTLCCWHLSVGLCCWIYHSTCVADIYHSTCVAESITQPVLLTSITQPVFADIYHPTCVADISATQSVLVMCLWFVEHLLLSIGGHSRPCSVLHEPETPAEVHQEDHEGEAERVCVQEQGRQGDGLGRGKGVVQSQEGVKGPQLSGWGHTGSRSYKLRRAEMHLLMSEDPNFSQMCVTCKMQWMARLLCSVVYALFLFHFSGVWESQPHCLWPECGHVGRPCCKQTPKSLNKPFNQLVAVGFLVFVFS